jgi:hypothetical protein
VPHLVEAENIFEKFVFRGLAPHNEATVNQAFGNARFGHEPRFVAALQ